MQKWDYVSVSINLHTWQPIVPGGDRYTVDSYLATLGDDGWELITVPVWEG